MSSCHLCDDSQLFINAANMERLSELSQPAKLHQTRPANPNRYHCCKFYCRAVRLIRKNGSRLCEDSPRFFAILRTERS